MRRHELADEQWELIEPILPVQRRGGRGRPPCGQRKMLNGMMWILRTGAPWRDLPERLGPRQKNGACSRSDDQQRGDDPIAAIVEVNAQK